MILESGDVVLIPAARDFVMSSLIPPEPGEADPDPVRLADGEVRIGPLEGPADIRLLIGYCEFGSPDAALLVPLLPRLIRVNGDTRLSTLLGLVGDEVHATRPARDVVLERLLEVLLIEILRSTAGTAASPGLLRGLADERVGAVLRRMHDRPQHSWTVPLLAAEASLSRSAFFERFRRSVGTAPMDYLLAWRMALAKDMLRSKTGSVAEIAEGVGYASATTFTIAFTREAGLSPTRYARGEAVARTKVAEPEAARPPAPHDADPFDEARLEDRPAPWLGDVGQRSATTDPAPRRIRTGSPGGSDARGRRSFRTGPRGLG